MKIKIKTIDNCPECKKPFSEMKLKCKFLCYGREICNLCMLKESQPDAE